METRLHHCRSSQGRAMLRPMGLARPRRRRTDDPDVCQVCGGEFVYPAEWQEVDETHQWVRLRCGACETWREDVFSDEALDRFDRRLDEAAELMADEADRLHWAWRAAEA